MCLTLLLAAFCVHSSLHHHPTPQFERKVSLSFRCVESGNLHANKDPSPCRKLNSQHDTLLFLSLIVEIIAYSYCTETFSFSPHFLAFCHIRIRCLCQQQRWRLRCGRERTSWWPEWLGTRSCSEGKIFDSLIIDINNKLCRSFQERIRVKSIAFEQKARDIKERLAKLAEAEHERFNRKEYESHEHSKFKTKHDLDGGEKPSKIRKNVGEEKYEQIYSISQSFGKSDQDITSLMTQSVNATPSITFEMKTLFPTSCCSIKWSPTW